MVSRGYYVDLLSQKGLQVGFSYWRFTPRTPQIVHTLRSGFDEFFLSLWRLRGSKERRKLLLAV